MRVASIVLVVLCQTAVAESVIPDRETELQAHQVLQLARLGRCDLALERAAEVAERDPAYYRQLVATDAGLFGCLEEMETARRYRSWRDRTPQTYTHRFGLDAMASIGPVVTLGGWFRYEHTNGLVLRLAGVRGQVIESEDNGADALIGHIGIRGYWGGFYLYAEAGGAAIRFREHADPFQDDRHPAEWYALPSFAAGLGSKFGRTDLGVSVLFPAVGIGAHLGFDFARL
jgi:hypothetical protein